MAVNNLHGRVIKFIRNFPIHIVLTIMVAISGYLFLLPVWGFVPGQNLFYAISSRDSATIVSYLQSGGAAHLTRIILGIYVQLMAIGLLVRARLAWVISLLLLIAMAIFHVWFSVTGNGLLFYTLALVVLLILTWSRFDRASLTAGSLFVLLGMVFLLLYAVLGALYLGTEFNPVIQDPVDALYFAIVSMSTVGYGDIVPKSDHARIFTVSVIILGITIFATSISALIGPLIGGNIKRLLHGKMTHVMRKNHTILAGSSPMAVSLYQALSKRGLDTTIILAANDSNNYPDDADIIVGDATETNVLQNAGANQAKNILALRQDDAENAFILLAARDCMGANTKLIAMVNSPAHLNKLKRVNPDVIISLQALGSEIIARTISGEPIDNDLITSLIFGENKK